MQVEKQSSFRPAVWIAVTILLVWALAVTLNIDAAWVSWLASAAFMVALASVFVRVWLRDRSVARTDEELAAELAAQRRRSRVLLIQIIPTLLLGLSSFLPISLVKAGIVPMWVGGIISFMLLAGYILLRALINRTGQQT